MSGISSKAINKTLLVFANFFSSEFSLYTDQTSWPVCGHDYRQLIKIRTPWMLKKIKHIDQENSLQQI